MAELQKSWLISLIFTVAISDFSMGKPRPSIYNQYYLDDICFNNRVGEFILQPLGSEAAVKINSSESLPIFRHHHCTLNFEPPEFHGVVLVLRNGYSADLFPGQCENHVEIFLEDEPPQKFCNFSHSAGVERIFNTAGPMKIRVSSSKSRSNLYLSMLLTAYDRRSFICASEQFRCDNSLCLWKGFVCDGENNCGDYSDELINENTSNCCKQNSCTLLD